MTRNNKTRRHFRSDAHGWKFVYVEGDARNRGFMHGQALHEELSQLMEMFVATLKDNNNVSLGEYLDLCNRLARKQFDESCKEWREELEGMVEGALSKGVVINVDFLFGINMYLGVDPFFDPKLNKLGFRSKQTKPRASDHCSAFIATGDATRDGKIVMAHNTHCEYIWAPFSNVIQYVKPARGCAFIMQTGPGLLSSNMDWFICESGIVGCETTIAGITYLPEYGIPYFCRIRECMQYGKTLDDYERIMCKDNAGDYPCGWMFGDLNTNEIMLLELGKTVSAVRRTHSGVFYGANFAHDPELREKETDNDAEMHDLKYSLGARNVRLDWLLNKEYWGKLDVRTAKKVISDHYDVFHNRVRKGARSICKHTEYENQKLHTPAFYPFGAIDGKVVAADMAKKLAFWGRWGSSCGRVFNVSRKYRKKHPYVPAFKNEPWIVIQPPSKN
jgi:hypothetical protein